MTIGRDEGPDQRFGVAREGAFYLRIRRHGQMATLSGGIPDGLHMDFGLVGGGDSRSMFALAKKSSAMPGFCEA
mgnify:CR=1 FL=1